MIYGPNDKVAILECPPSTLQPRGTRTVRPGYEMETSRLRPRSSKFRIVRAPKVALIIVN
jgi:hypothetical protein